MTTHVPFSCPRTCPRADDRWCRFRAVLDVLGPVRVDSHTAKVDVEYRDQDAIRQAVERMGGIWLGHGLHDLHDTKQTGYGFRLRMEGGTKRVIDGVGYWYHPLVLCDDGKLAYDEFGGTWGNVADLKVLQAEYAMAAVERAAMLQGWQTERTAEGLTVYHPQGGTMTYRDGVLEAHEFVGTGCHDAMLQLGLPLTDLRAKPEFQQQVATVQVGG